MTGTKITARLVGITQPTIELRTSSAEGLIAYCAKVSNPEYQDSDGTKLLDYCKRNGHWSVFEMANAVVEVEAPRDITRQLLRHRSFSFQEFSQRYSDSIDFTTREVRNQDTKNRQNSIDNVDDNISSWAEEDMNAVESTAWAAYYSMITNGIAKECARVVLPEGLTMSRMYVNGTLRSWIHYLDVREGNGTQKEHMELANKIREVLKPAFESVL